MSDPAPRRRWYRNYDPRPVLPLTAVRVNLAGLPVAGERITTDPNVPPPGGWVALRRKG